MGALLFQLGISGPLLVALIFYTAARRKQSLIHAYLFWVLAMILLWTVGMVVQFSDLPQRDLLIKILVDPPSAFMSPVFALVMLLYARVEIFEESRTARWSLLAPFALYLAAFATNDWHGLMTVPQPARGDEAATPAGALFWSFQACSNATAVLGLGIGVWLAWSAPTRAERRRMLLLCIGALLPLVAHMTYIFQLVPMAYPVTPAALAMTSALLVLGLRRYRLLDAQPIARRDVIEASGDAVVIADAEHRVVDLNRAALEMLGASREAHLGRGLAEIVPGIGLQDTSGLERLLEMAAAGETPPASEFETRDGRTLEASAGHASGASGAAAGFFLVLRDRTRERRAQRMLQQSQRLESVGILAAGVAHEVNNPLAFVRANLAHLHQMAGELEARADELPKDLRDQTDDLAEVTEQSLSGLDRIQKIVRDLLRVSRTASDRVESCDPNAIVREAARFASLHGDAAVRLEDRLDPLVPQIQAASDQLVQVLLNLFLNARQALSGRSDAVITASSRVCGDHVEIRVGDNGPGVHVTIRDRIFDPFFTTRGPNQGTGLGLAIAFDIVREHGGTLELEPPGDGGASFLIRLPIRREAAATDA